ncbi:phosphotransferase enzyme family protein [Lutimonas zeaxanthinifaciens]|uniref:phosphotransferase enzyme family protein n=1 Tax=Lutimonas zeaxanthinifaciens TaxID=3060215 RepID=UPI00265D2B0E|nr:aminoglycoside phosphotransferase family protein [Lutimonas sp. YSD2104]WKK66119.1 aminoglycoside phosphotransferase family protein [Lutimonas sp. YSD2104]
MKSISEDVFKFFLPEENLVSGEELTSGHINDTYLVKGASDKRYIFQKINKDVFPDVPGLIMNKVQLSRHLHKKHTHLPVSERERRVLTFVRSNEGTYHYRDKNGNYWNVTLFVEKSQNFESVEDKSVACEGGKLFGSFIRDTEDFDPGKLIEVIPKFHDMSFRFEQFDRALEGSVEERKVRAHDLILKALALRTEMQLLEKLKNDGEIRIRVTHNDTKISNALFDLEGKGLCVIDTDTIMPGIIHYDFGDAIRTICNTAREDETNLDLVNFNKEYYDSYLKGYLEALGNSVSVLEKKYFPLAAKTMIFIMALRFLTDYLNNDVYYKTNYPEHNLDRSKNQFKLIDSFDSVMGEVS